MIDDLQEIVFSERWQYTTKSLQGLQLLHWHECKPEASASQDPGVALILEEGYRVEVLTMSPTLFIPASFKAFSKLMSSSLLPYGVLRS